MAIAVQQKTPASISRSCNRFGVRPAGRTGRSDRIDATGFVALSGAACPGRSGTPATTLPRIPSMTTARAFRGFRFPAEVILWAVRWYLQFPISYRDLEAMLADRGVAVDHTIMYR